MTNVGINKDFNVGKRKCETLETPVATKQPRLQWTKITDFPSLLGEDGNKARINVQLKIRTKIKNFDNQYRWRVSDLGLGGGAKTTMMMWTSEQKFEDFFNFFKVHENFLQILLTVTNLLLFGPLNGGDEKIIEGASGSSFWGLFSRNKLKRLIILTNILYKNLIVDIPEYQVAECGLQVMAIVTHDCC